MKLVENGLHSLKKAIDNTKTLDGLEGINRELAAKETIVNLHHSIETLFKYIIREKNELLIYDNLDDFFGANINVIRKKGKTNFTPKTITFMNAVDRVVVLNKLEISAIDYGSFEHLNGVRNAITHFEYNLENDLINHLIIQVISAVFPIYKEFIPDFEKYVIENDLNIVGSIQYKEFNIWKFIRYFNLIHKFKDAETTFNGIKQDGKFERKQNEISKEKYITYHKCPCCEKEFFVKDNLILYGTEEKSYEGRCLMCGITFDKNDSYFLYLLSEDYNTFGYRGDFIIRDLLVENNIIENITSEELVEIKKICTNPENRDILVNATTEMLIGRIDFILSNYNEEIVYDYDSEKLDAALYEKSINNSIEIDFLKEKDIMSLKEIIFNFNTIGLSKDFYEKAFNQDYIFYAERSHPNPHNDNEDEHIEITHVLTLWESLITEILDGTSVQ